MKETCNSYWRNPVPCNRTRREFLWELGGGFAGLALIDLLSRDGFFQGSAFAAGFRADEARNPLAPKPPHFPAKAKHAVFLFMNGGPSQVDTFDPKPALSRFNGTLTGRHQAGRLERTARRPSDADRLCRSRSAARAGWRSAACSPHCRSSPTTFASSARCTPTRLPTPRVCLQMNTGSVQHRQAEPGILAQLRTGHGQREPAQLRRDDRPARRAHQPALPTGRLATCRPPTRERFFEAQGTPLLDLATPDRRQRRNAAPNTRSAAAAEPRSLEFPAGRIGVGCPDQLL